MADFKRRMDVAPLQRLADSATPNWWKDLLSLWAPPGRARGDRRLRLAVRDGYLNFYLRGQSVARVHIGRDGVPVADVHVKYAFANAQGQSYARLIGTDVTTRMETPGSYEGIGTLREWMARAAEYETDEKALVERIINDNPLVLDIEMGLPADGAQSSQRMDLVALEDAEFSDRLVFWEVKRFIDPRNRPDRKGDVKVVGQVQRYTHWLASPDNCTSVTSAYAQVRVLINEFAEMAGLPPVFVPGRVGSRPLIIDPVPRLLVFGTVDELNGSAWTPHRSRLLGVGVVLHEVATDAYALPMADKVTTFA